MNAEEIDILNKALYVLAKKAPRNVVEYFNEFSADVLRFMDGYSSVSNKLDDFQSMIKGEQQIAQGALVQPTQVATQQQVAPVQPQQPSDRLSFM